MEACRWLSPVPITEAPKIADALVGWFYQLYTVDGTWTLKDLDNRKLDVKTTRLDQFIKDNPDI